MDVPRFNTFNSKRKGYEAIICDLEEIVNTSINDLKRYENFLFLSIQYKSYVKILPILEKLNEKFPDNPKIKSRLGKTLGNQVGQQERGRKLLREAIELFKNDNNSQQAQQHIIYYLYNFLNNQEMKSLKEEFETYKSYLIRNSDYFRFMAYYSFANNQNIDEAILLFEQAIEIAESLMNKREFAESLLRFLSEQNSKLHKSYLMKYEIFL